LEGRPLSTESTSYSAPRFGGHRVDGKRPRSGRAYTAAADSSRPIPRGVCARSRTRPFQISQYCRTRLGYLCEKLGRGPLDLAPQRIEPIPSASAPATSARCNLSRCVCSSRAPGGQRTAIRLTPAPACVSSSMRLLISSGATTDNPVALLPGRARLVTSPLVMPPPAAAELPWAARRLPPCACRSKTSPSSI
jgi:hypothetical protein